MDLSGQLHTSGDLKSWVGPRTRLVGKQNRKKNSFPIPAIDDTNRQPHADVMHSGRNNKIDRTIWVNKISSVWRVCVCVVGGGVVEAAGKVLTL